MAKYGKKTGKGSKERKVFLPESDMSPGGRQTGMMLSYKVVRFENFRYWLLKRGVNFGLWIWFWDLVCIFASLLHCRRGKAPGRKPACPGGEVPHQTCPAV